MFFYVWIRLNTTILFWVSLFANDATSYIRLEKDVGYIPFVAG